MSEVIQDSAIKLFGQTISLPSHKVVSHISLSEHTTSISQDSKDESGEDSTGIIHEYESINPREEKSASSDTSDDQNSVKKDEEKATTLKKPDKIIPCPRCNSMDTKFCYYNNYNVNQPRHFCKNCQRYWTSGGTMRNVPVGSGRRKNKNIIYPHVMFPDATIAKGVHLKPNVFLISPQGFPVSFYPATFYWGSPKVSPAAHSMTSVLGKHSRGGENLDAETTSVLIPKTLRMHDPSEAAKSSVRSNLGIKNQKTGDGLYMTFESKGDNNVDNRAMVLQANPAALCRSLNFHEST